MSFILIVIRAPTGESVEGVEGDDELIIRGINVLESVERMYRKERSRR
jgi:hypothetical protein